MKAHFVTSIDSDKQVMSKIANIVTSAGHDLITDHYLYKDRTLDDILTETPQQSELYAKKTQKWMGQADAIIFETTAPDLSVGFELALALNMMKPVIVLYADSGGVAPFSLKGITSDKLQLISYNSSTLDEILTLALDFASDASDIRFNFFISPKIGKYLEWISKNRKVPRSVFLRDLIEKHMAQDNIFLEENT